MIEGLVSVVIPFHDRRRFLREAIESVLVQTYPHWELVLVDDGSSDGSAEIARDYAQRFPAKIKCMEHAGHANLGVTRTRNLGASMSRGEYLAFLDSDDVWMPHKLEDQVELMRKHPEVGLVCAPSKYWFDWDQDVPPESRLQNYIPALAPAGRAYKSPFLLIHTHPVGKWGAPCPSSFLIRRSIFEMVGGFVEEFNPNTWQLCEDSAFLAKIYLSSTRVMISETCSDYYRGHATSIWYRAKGQKKEELELKFYFQWLRRFLLERNCKEKAVWRATRRAGWMYWWPLPHHVTWTIRRIVNKWRMIRGQSIAAMME